MTNCSATFCNKMESVQNFFDEEGHFAVDFDEVFDENPIQDSLIESPLVSASSGHTNLNAVTLASLNTDGTDSENLFNLGFDQGRNVDCVVGLASVASDHGSYSKATQEESIRSSSPMSCMSVTASLSGSEPYSSPRQSERDETDMTDQDLLEYLLQDSNISHQDGDEGTEDGQTVADVKELTRPKRQMTLRNRSSSISTRGVSNHSGPWCKTKDRNNSRNAVAARENRQKKKMYLQALEDANEKLTNENTRLKTESTQAKKKIGSLEGEVQYLRKVLFNQSTLAGLLKKMDHQSDVHLSFNREESQQDDAPSSSSGGICLHVNGQDASLKFCASCARNDHP